MTPGLLLLFALLEDAPPAAFEDATKRLAALVDRQRIVWVEGVHLPQSISLSERASGVTLAR